MIKKLKYFFSLSAKFTYFESARILYQRDQLYKIICGYPWFKLRNEGIQNLLFPHTVSSIFEKTFFRFFLR